jgi:hypothetical protein
MWVGLRFHGCIHSVVMSKFPDNLPAEIEERLFYEELGRAVAYWGQVEGQVAVIFSRIMGRTTQSYRAANIALNTVLSFRTKLDMTHGAVTSLLAHSDDALAEWNTLKKTASRRNDRRNELAHFGVVSDPKGKPGYRYRLQPHIWNMREHQRWAGRLPPARTVCEIHVVGQSFIKLAMDLRRFFLAWIEPIEPPDSEIQ